MAFYELGIIQCDGVDAEKFLQGQLSADITQLTPTQGTLACYLNLKGRVVALMAVISRPGGYWLVLPRDMVSPLIHKLHKFIVFSKATLMDVSDQYAITGAIVPPHESAAYQVIQKNDDLDFVLTETLQLHITPRSQGTTSMLSPEFMKAQFQALIPWIGHAQSEQFLPHYIGLVKLGAVSFDKGCFVGQEVVARMHYRGHLNKGLLFTELQQGEVVNRLNIGDQHFFLVSSDS